MVLDSAPAKGTKKSKKQKSQEATAAKQRKKAANKKRKKGEMLLVENPFNPQLKDAATAKRSTKIVNPMLAET